MTDIPKYYKWSLKWTYDSHSEHHVFYRPENRGYTMNLDEAGVFLYNKIDHCDSIIENKEDVLTAKTLKLDVCAVPVEKVELLGKKVTCIHN